MGTAWLMSVNIEQNAIARGLLEQWHAMNHGHFLEMPHWHPLQAFL